MTRRILLIAIAVMTGITGGSASEPGVSFEDQVREAVFRYLFKSEDPDKIAEVYFVAILDGDKQRDASPALMKRFTGHRPRVVPASSAKVGFEGAVQRDTGASGIVFHVGAIKRVSEDVLEVEAGHYTGNLSASGGTYRVERKDGVWVVTKWLAGWVA
jgi:hypothetical protein